MIPMAMLWGGIGAPNEVVLSFPLMAKNLDIKFIINLLCKLQ